MSKPGAPPQDSVYDAADAVPGGGFESGVRLLVPRAGGRVIARFTTVLMLLVVATPSECYLTAIAIAVIWIAVAVGYDGSVNLPGFVGRVSGQVREHLFRVTADWMTVAGYLVIGLLWTFLTPRPSWLMALPVGLTAFACWTAQFAALPTGAMGRWFSFQWLLIHEMLGNPFRKKSAAEEKETQAPAPAPVNPFEVTHWPSQQQERFDDWLAEEVRRFEAEGAAIAGQHPVHSNDDEQDPYSTTRQLNPDAVFDGDEPDTEAVVADHVEGEPSEAESAEAEPPVAAPKIRKLK